MAKSWLPSSDGVEVDGGRGRPGSAQIWAEEDEAGTGWSAGGEERHQGQSRRELAVEGGVGDDTAAPDQGWEAEATLRGRAGAAEGVAEGSGGSGAGRPDLVKG